MKWIDKLKARFEVIGYRIENGPWGEILFFLVFVLCGIIAACGPIDIE